LFSEYGGSVRNDWFVSANVDQIRVLLGRSYSHTVHLICTQLNLSGSSM
jgi:hypothetical protein